jgi:nitrate/TMAO reductase-like tetraheme cytochrome c subunit
MVPATVLILSLILVTIILIGVLVAHPSITAGRSGKILAFVCMFCLPIFCGLLGVSREMARAKTTTFCLSCHTMEAYGKSLLVDDLTHIPAAHFQNHLVPPALRPRLKTSSSTSPTTIESVSTVISVRDPSKKERCTTLTQLLFLRLSLINSPVSLVVVMN